MCLPVDSPIHGTVDLNAHATQAQRNEILRLLEHDHFKKHESFRPNWAAAAKAMQGAAAVVVRTSLSYIDRSIYADDFKGFPKIGTLPPKPAYRITHLGFLSAKITKALEKYLNKTGMNHGHGPDWASETLMLDDNYRAAEQHGSPLLAVFDPDVRYTVLTTRERDAVNSHLSPQLNPVQL